MEVNHCMIMLIELLQDKILTFGELYFELDKYKKGFENANEFYKKVFTEDYLQTIQDNFIN